MQWFRNFNYLKPSTPVLTVHKKNGLNKADSTRGEGGGGGEQFLIHEKLAQWTTFQEHDLLIKNKSNIKFAFPDRVF